MIKNGVTGVFVAVSSGVLEGSVVAPAETVFVLVLVGVFVRVFVGVLVRVVVDV